MAGEVGELQDELKDGCNVNMVTERADGWLWGDGMKERVVEWIYDDVIKNELCVCQRK